MNVIIKKGNHFSSIKSQIGGFLKVLFKDSVEVTFSEDSKYDLKDSDQKDWNKILGRGGLKIKEGIRKNESFWVWRYNIEEDIFEVTFYWRKDYKFDYNRHYYKLKVGDTIKISCRKLYGLLPLTPYFGGNRVAPNNIKFEIK